MILSRRNMLPIMEEAGALDHLDINEEDFLHGHGREETHVKVMQGAYALAMEHAFEECLMAVSDSDFAAEAVRAAAKRLGVQL